MLGELIEKYNYLDKTISEAVSNEVDYTSTKLIDAQLICVKEAILDYKAQNAFEFKMKFDLLIEQISNLDDSTPHHVIPLQDLFKELLEFAVENIDA